MIYWTKEMLLEDALSWGQLITEIIATKYVGIDKQDMFETMAKYSIAISIKDMSTYWSINCIFGKKPGLFLYLTSISKALTCMDDIDYYIYEPE